jgi:hypothetical protein
MLLSPHPFLQDLQQLKLLCPQQVLVFSWSSGSLLRIPSQDDPSFGQLLWICTLEPNTCHDTCDLISFTSFFGVQFQMHSFDYCSIVAQQHYGNFSSLNWGAKLSSWSGYLADILQKANQFSYKTHWWSPNLERCPKTSPKFLCIQSSTKSLS